MSTQVWVAVAVLGVALLVMLRRPLRLVGRLLARWGVAMAVLWGLQNMGLGLSLGFNLFNGLVLGVLGAPGLGLLLLAQWVLR